MARVRPEIELENGQKERSESCLNGTSQEYHSNRGQQIRNDLSVQLSQTFGPTLTVMKLAGELFGETSLSEPRARRNSAYISRLYSSVVVFSKWLLVVMALITLFYEGFTSMNVFFFLFIPITWYIHCASNATICLVVLPLAKSKSSRFANFISSFITTATELEGISQKTLKGLAIACVVAVVNAVVIFLFSLYHGGIISSFKPWNGHMTVRFLEIAVGAIYCSFAWSLPVHLYCTTCLVLERMFETLKNKVTSTLDTERPFTISWLRQEYLRLCKILEIANKVFSPFLFGIVVSYIPLICVNLYQLIKFSKNWSSDRRVVLFTAYLYWSFWSASILAVLCLFGSRLNEKDIKENSELMLFLAHVQGESIGLSAGGLAVINKSFFLTLVGIIASYFAVLLTLP